MGVFSNEPEDSRPALGRELGDTEPGGVFQRLAELVYADEDPKSIHRAITGAACVIVDGCDHASIMVASHGHFTTTAATDETAAHVDRIEREVGEGPCVDAILNEDLRLDTDIEASSLWPAMAARMLAETPVRGVIAYRILTDDRKVGALNLFSDTPGALTMQSVNQGAILASFASTAFMTLSAKGQAETMSRGLASNREIGKAIGLLMASHSYSEDEAFELLRTTSQRLNMKISAVSRKIVEGQQARPAGKPRSGDRSVGRLADPR